MSEETKVFESELEGGIKYEIHVSTGFSGRSEIAIKVEGIVVSAMSAEVKRSGNIYCRPARLKTTLIKKEKVNIAEQASPLDLSDVLGDGDDNEELNQEQD